MGKENKRLAVIKEFPHARFMETGLEFLPGMSLEEWRDLGGRLGKFHRFGLLMVGDWIVKGKREYGEDQVYQDIEKVTGLSSETLRKAEYVAEHVSSFVRQRTLSYSHHDTVAALSSDEQKIWLYRAERGGWSVSELRRQVRMSRALSDKQANELDFHFLGEGFRNFKVKVESIEDTKILERARHDAVEEFSKIETVIVQTEKRLEKMGISSPPLNPRVEVLNDEAQTGERSSFRLLRKEDLEAFRNTVNNAEGEALLTKAWETIRNVSDTIGQLREELFQKMEALGLDLPWDEEIEIDDKTAQEVKTWEQRNGKRANS